MEEAVIISYQWLFIKSLISIYFQPTNLFHIPKA